MTKIVPRKAPVYPPISNPDRDRALWAWLWIVAVMIIAMVLVGGATRLTQSGLSITEWKPIHGVIPPLNEAEWNEEFLKYQQIPEYREINKGMSLSDFQFIFWWEWSHRLLGRLIGFVFLVPFLAFVATKHIHRDNYRGIGVLFLLGGLQGAVGWWMVASGLVDRTDVSQYRLATHLTLASFILVATVWTAEGYRACRSAYFEPRDVSRSARIVVAAILVQIFLGGLVAGLNAGLTYNTWPLMDGGLIPPDLLTQSPLWTNFFENVATVQFVHRLGAYVVLALTAYHLFVARHSVDPLVRRRAAILMGIVGFQALLGITTLLLVVPLPLALAHQLVAVLALTAATVHARRTVAED
ncbi:COX15/CtaA family protein [Oryzibacter oryziterrae]|uniref:COX15/CtaA family protein n=1 Tax=Oryzibacter oryziterrae TaxID=2766474 RepID=UPI001F208AD4|nr:COX15/CtaA family protein [Oryzibacter oryziterrae]